MISVIVPTYNHAEFLPQALESIFSQTCGDHEIIVVDDGSSDETRSALAPFSDRITYLYQENQGPSVARNRGIRAAQGEYITFLDADDLWLPDKLEAQRAEMEREPRPGLVGCGFYTMDAEGRIKDTIDKGLSPERFMSQIGTWNVFGNPSCAMVPKSVFDDVGCFNEKLRFGEDWEMWLRIAENTR